MINPDYVKNALGDLVSQSNLGDHSKKDILEVFRAYQRLYKERALIIKLLELENN